MLLSLLRVYFNSKLVICLAFPIIYVNGNQLLTTTEYGLYIEDIHSALF